MLPLALKKPTLNRLNRLHQRVDYKGLCSVSTFGSPHDYDVNFNDISLGGGRFSGPRKLPFLINTIVEITVPANTELGTQEFEIIAKVVRFYERDGKKYFGLKFITDIDERRTLENFILKIENKNILLGSKSA